MRYDKLYPQSAHSLNLEILRQQAAAAGCALLGALSRLFIAYGANNITRI